MLQSGNLQEANKIYESLSKAFQEFLKVQARCQELQGVDAHHEDKAMVLDEVQKMRMMRIQGLLSSASIKAGKEVRSTYCNKCPKDQLIQHTRGPLDYD